MRKAALCPGPLQLQELLATDTMYSQCMCAVVV